MSELPPWLSQSADPASAFLRAYTVGQSAAHARASLDQQASEAQMRHEIELRSAQQNHERQMQEMSVQSAYHQLQIQLRGDSLDETKNRAKAAQDEAALVISDTQRFANDVHSGMDPSSAMARSPRAHGPAVTAILNSEKNPREGLHKPIHEPGTGVWEWNPESEQYEQTVNFNKAKPTPRPLMDTYTESIADKTDVPGSPEVPELPAKRILGIPIPFTGQSHVPAVPAIPGHRAYKVTRHVPVGSSIPDLPIPPVTTPAGTESVADDGANSTPPKDEVASADEADEDGSLASPWKPEDKQQYDEIEKGEHYIHPRDGKVYVKQ